LTGALAATAVAPGTGAVPGAASETLALALPLAFALHLAVAVLLSLALALTKGWAVLASALADLAGRILRAALPSPGALLGGEGER
jgi:hypothetical protein